MKSFPAGMILLIAAVLYAAVVPASAEYRVAAFAVDVSPPLGREVDIGFRKAVAVIEHPALLKGIVLDAPDARFLIAAIDYCGLCNDSYDVLRARMAAAADLPVTNVALQSLHQHTTVCLDRNAAKIMYRDAPERLTDILEFEEELAERVERAVVSALTRLTPVTQVGISQARVEQVASSRRLRQPDGRIIARASSTQDPALHALPEGLIDPWLKSISFLSDKGPIVQLHYYATHPQSFYNHNHCTWDVPGIARERLEKETGVTQIYFTGCGGNVAMGKYNDGSPEARTALAERLYQGMRDSLAHQTLEPVAPLTWRTTTLQFPLRTDPPFLKDSCRQVIEDRQQSFNQRLKAAMCLAWIERVESGRPVELASLHSGSWSVLHLPGEPFVEYQLAAQKLQPNRFVVTAGYGDCAMWYLGPDTLYTDQGGYEQSWAFTGPCETQLTNALKTLLGSAAGPE